MALKGAGLSANRTTVQAKKNPAVVIGNGAPSSNNVNFQDGTIWIDQANSDAYIKIETVAGSATWELFVNSTGAILTLTGSSGGAIEPDGSGNITLTGDSTDGVTVVGTTNTLTVNIEAASTTQRGTAETATDAEAISAASTSVVLTPSNLAAITATNMTALSASGSDTNSASSTAKYVTPGSLASLTATNMAALAASTAQVQARSSTAVVPTASSLSGIFSGSNMTFNSDPILQSTATTGAAPAGTTGAVNIMSFPTFADAMYQVILGAGSTIIAPRMASTGLVIGLDDTDDEGAEYGWNATGALVNAKHVYTIGTSAAFFMEAVVTVADTSGGDPLLFGFRKVQAFQTDFASYTDFASIGLNRTVASEVICLATQLNTGGVVNTNSTDGWVDGATKTLKILISGAGQVTYTIGGSAPTVTAAYSFDSGDQVIPFIFFLNGADGAGAVSLTSLKVGFQ